MREFEEEAGVTTAIVDWKIIGKITFSEGTVVFYASHLDDERFNQITTMTDEEVTIENVNEVISTNKFLSMDADACLCLLSYLSRGNSLKHIYIEYGSDMHDLYPQFNKSPEEISTRAEEIFKSSIRNKYDHYVKHKPYYTLNSAELAKMLKNLGRWEELDPQKKSMFMKAAKNEIIKLKVDKLLDEHPS